MALPLFFGLLRESWDSLGVRDDPRVRPEKPQEPLQRPQEPRQCHSCQEEFLDVAMGFPEGDPVVTAAALPAPIAA